jgi:urease beta subunit
MKKMNKVIAAMMMMAITFAMPAMAGNKKNNHGKNDKVLAVQATGGRAVVVNNDKKASHFDKVDKKTSHFDTSKTHAYRPDVKTCTIKVSRHDSHKKVVAKVENIKGVMDTNWNPRTRELTVRYDANKTSAHNIKHFVA